MESEKNNPTPNKAEILLVEDSLTQAIQIKHLLESHQYKVTVTQNGKQAMDRLSKHRPSLVISDILMPEMNGYELCKKIRSNKSTEDIPVILLTRLVDPEEIIEGLSCGADSFITKPYNEKYLLSHIEKILSGENVATQKKVSFGAQILFKGKERLIQTEQQNVINLMLSIYEGAILQNEKLIQTQEELRLLNERLESLVEDRTSDLTEEIKLSNQINKRLKESEEKWRILVTTIPEYIGLIDCEGKFLFLNHYAEGFSEKDTIGKSHLDFIPNEWKEFYRQKFEKCISTQKNQIFEYTAFGDNYAIRTYETCLVPIIQQCKVSNVMAIARDITGRKQAEDKLRSSEERLKILFDYAPDAYYLNDLRGNLIDGNIVAEKLLGYNKNELIGKSFLKLNLLSLKQIPRAAKLLVKNALGQGTGPDEFVLSRKDGSKVTVEIVTHPVKLKDKTLVLGLARDISERKKAEEALRVSEEKYRRIFENVQDVFYELSIRGKILEVSPSIEILSKGQYKRDDLIGKSMYDFYPDPTERRTLLNVLRERGFISDFEINLKNRDGSGIPCSVSAKIIFNVQGHPEKIIGSMHDITDRKNAIEALKFAKEKAEASDKLKTTFLNNISHEVRTPLNGILGFAEILSHPGLSEEEKKDSISMLFESSDRLLNTITNYMDISLIISGNISVHKKDFIPGQILRNIFDKYKTICSERKLELFLKIPEHTDNLSVNSDPEIFQKIISHLLNNAIKFTEKGSINYGYLIHEGELGFFVKDTGIGIGKESLKSVFEHFVKEDRGPLKLTEGSGLGLSIAKGMIGIIGSNIRVESEIGVGSCFSFAIPLIKDTEITLSGTSGREHNKPISGASILVAEDDETNFFYLKTLLTRETGAKVLHASNGREAITLFKGNPGIILILMDIKMPEIDGLEATRQIKLIRKEVPVIALTGYAMAGDEERVLAAGCDGYLTKPINKKILLEKMAEFITI